MKSFEERFCVTAPGAMPRLGRDIRLAWFLAGMLWRNLTIGGRVRRRYRACRAKDEPFFVDENMPGAKPASAPGPATRPAGERR
jgi:hypothetical protein